MCKGLYKNFTHQLKLYNKQLLNTWNISLFVNSEITFGKKINGQLKLLLIIDG